MPAVVKDLGPIFGFISFAVFVGLLGLYVRRTLEMRRLRRVAPFLAERNGQRAPARSASRRVDQRVRR